MMESSSALRRLHTLLKEALKNGDRGSPTREVLNLKADSDEKAQQLIAFFELLGQAQEEAKRLKRIPNYDDYINSLEALANLFIHHPVYTVKWDVFAASIESRGHLLAVDALANYYQNSHSEKSLPQDFLENLIGEFENILDGVTKSSLSKELKLFLIRKVEDILSAIRRYSIDGTEGLQKAIKSFVCDSILIKDISKDDKENLLFKRTVGFVFATLMYLKPTPYDVIGVYPDASQFWVPKIRELLAGSKQIQSFMNSDTSIQELLEKSWDVFGESSVKLLSPGEDTDIKALPAGKEDDDE